MGFERGCARHQSDRRAGARHRRASAAGLSSVRFTSTLTAAASPDHGSWLVRRDDVPAGLTPVRLLARRAGDTVTTPLAATGTGMITLPTPGRWFVYAELRAGPGRSGVASAKGTAATFAQDDASGIGGSLRKVA